MDNTQSRKIRKSGNSYVLTIPPNMLKALDLAEGDTVQLTKENNSIEITKQEPDVINEEFLKLVDTIYDENKDIFKSLVDK